MEFNPPIKAEWFYTDESEQTKINWFCFEYALEFYTFIMKSEALRKYRARNSNGEIAVFCAYFAKRMKKSVYDQLGGITPVIIIDEEYIADYYPKNTQHQNIVFIDVAGEAWEICYQPARYARCAVSANVRKEANFSTAIKKADTGVSNDKRDVGKTD